MCVLVWIQSWWMCLSLAGEQRGLLGKMPQISPFFMSVSVVTKENIDWSKNTSPYVWQYLKLFTWHKPDQLETLKTHDIITSLLDKRAKVTVYHVHLAVKFVSCVHFLIDAAIYLVIMNALLRSTCVYISERSLQLSRKKLYCGQWARKVSYIKSFRAGAGWINVTVS